jgi:Activator of Hsp90 ATPase homolog 1-like protein
VPPAEQRVALALKKVAAFSSIDDPAKGNSNNSGNCARRENYCGVSGSGLESSDNCGKAEEILFGADVASDWKVGSPITMRDEIKGKAYQDKGEILAIEPEAKLSFSHWSALSGDADLPDNYHVVSFDLSPQDHGTRVTLTQSNLNGRVKPSDRAHKAVYERNWQGVLDGLANTVAKH